MTWRPRPTTSRPPSSSRWRRYLQSQNFLKRVISYLYKYFIILILNAEIIGSKANLISFSRWDAICFLLSREVKAPFFWTEKGSVVDLDRHSSAFIWGSVLGMRIHIKENGNGPKFTNKHGSLSFVYVLPFYLWYKSCLCINSSFCDLEICPGSGSVLVWLPGSGSGSAMR
jgi:hypothetical protein